MMINSMVKTVSGTISSDWSSMMSDGMSNGVTGCISWTSDGMTVGGNRGGLEILIKRSIKTQLRGF